MQGWLQPNPSRGPTRGRLSLDPAVERRLEEELGPGQPNLAFVRAVVQHLSGAPGSHWSRSEAADQVLRALRAATGDGPPPRLDPDDNARLLASFFQNADLLDAAAPESARVSVWVMRQLEDAGPDVGQP